MAVIVMVLPWRAWLRVAVLALLLRALSTRVTMVLRRMRRMAAWLSVLWQRVAVVLVSRVRVMTLWQRIAFVLVL